MKMKAKTTAKKRIQQIEVLLSNATVKANMDSFLNKYVLCELACKLIIMEYKAAKKQSLPYNDIKMQTQVIVAACHHVCLKVSDEVLRRLFSSADKRGSYSAKKLRDAIVHSMSINDIKEVNTRSIELHADMDAFLNAL